MTPDELGRVIPMPTGYAGTSWPGPDTANQMPVTWVPVPVGQPANPVAYPGAAEPSWARRFSLPVAGAELADRPAWTSLAPVEDITTGAQQVVYVLLLPIRVAALGLLWATSTSARLLFVAAAGLALFLFLH